MESSKNTAAAPDVPAADPKVIESLVVRGDLSGLDPTQRARFYVQMCEGLGLNPNAQPFAFLRLNGKEILYATRGATDQLAAIHHLTREIIDGPKVIDLAGTKLVYAVARARHPNGRVETATATVPLADPQNVLMKCETKAKRRVTLSILGLGVLDELELETIPAAAQEPGSHVDLMRVQGAPSNDAAAESSYPEPAPVADEPPAPVEIPAVLEGFYARVCEIELPGEAVSVWLKFRGELSGLAAVDREAAWKALCKRTEDVGRMKNAKVWLKKAIAEEDHRRATNPDARDVAGESPRPLGFTAEDMASWRGSIATAPTLEALVELERELTDNSLATAEQVKVLRDAITRRRRDFDAPPPSNGNGGGRGRGSSARASGTSAGGASTSSGPTSAADLDAFAAHLRAKPEVGADRGAGAVAGAWWAHRGPFVEAGLYEKSLRLVLDELTRRGVAEPHAWLQKIGVRNGHVTPTTPRDEVDVAA